MSAFSPSAILPRAIPDEVRSHGREVAAGHVGKLAGVLLPSFGSAIFVIVLMNVLFLSAGTRMLFRDGDTGWHVRTGEAIIAQRAVPTTDTFSLIHAGRGWFAWEWLAEVLLGGAHLLAGPAGVALLAALVIALTGWGAWRLALSLGGNLFLALAMLLPLLGASTIHWLARPHIFSWLLALAFMTIAERYRRGLPVFGSKRSLLLLPLLSCLWANVHGSFLLGTALLLIYAVGAWLQGRERATAGRHFALAGLATLLASFINPYGWHVHQHIFAYLRNTYLMDHISEFRSFSFHGPGAIYVEMFLLLAAAGTFLLFRQKAYGPALLSLALMHMSLYSARHLPTYAILMSPIFVAAISAEWSPLPRLQSAVRYSARLLAMDRRVLGVVPSVLGLLLVVIALRAESRADRVGFDSRKFPVAAASFLTAGPAGENIADRRVFARDYWGGYLIYRFAGELKVFVDGRSDFYREDWLETYAQINEVKPGWDRLLDGFQINTVLIPPAHPLAGALRLHTDWRLAYADGVAAVFERKAL